MDGRNASLSTRSETEHSDEIGTPEQSSVSRIESNLDDEQSVVSTVAQNICPVLTRPR